jgi:hypothetical protein
MAGRRLDDSRGNSREFEPVNPANFQSAHATIHQGKIFDSRSFVNSLKSALGCIVL